MQVNLLSNINLNSKSNFYFGLITVVTVSVGLLLNIFQPGVIDIDGGIFSAVAYKDLNGGLLYHDAWENKMPGIFYLLESLYFIFPNPIYVNFFLTIIVLLIISIGFYLISFHYSKSVFISLFLEIIFLVLFIQPQFIGDGLSTELFASACLILSLISFYYPFQISKINNEHLAAFFCGLSIWFKEIFLLLALIVFGMIWLKNKNKWLILIFFLPSILISTILILQGSFNGFIDSVIYNFAYVSNGEKANYMDKIKMVFESILYPILALVFLYFYILFQLLKTNKKEAIIFLTLIPASLLLYIISPYSFGHYLIPFVIFLFISLMGLIKIFIENKLPLTMLYLSLIISAFTLGKKVNVKLVYQISAFKHDVISKKLIEDKDASLFVDFVDAVPYYIKGKKKHHAFLPVPLRVHFEDNATGTLNRNRLWKELSENPPKYLITSFTTSFAYWHLPHNGFYEKKYEKTDSVLNKNKEWVYLWQLKK